MKQYIHSDFEKMLLPHSSAFSPNGDKVAFLVRIADSKKDCYHSKIYVTDYASGKTQRLTNYGAEGNFTWKDNDTLIFPSLREDKDKKLKEQGEQLTVFYEISVEGGEAQEIFRVAINGACATYLGNDKYIIKAVFDNAYPDLEGLSGKARENALADWREQADYEVVSEFPYRFDGMGYINQKRNRLYFYDKAENKLSPITEKLFATSGFVMNEDKSVLYYFGETHMGDTSYTSGIYAYNIATGKTEIILPEGKYAVNFLAIMNNKLYFTGKIVEYLYVNGEYQLWELTLGENEPKIVYVPIGDFGFAVVTDGLNGAGNSFKAEQNKLYFLETTRFGCGIYAFDGKVAEKVSDDEIQIASFDVKNNKISVVGIEYNDPSEIYAIEGNNFRKITKINEEFKNEYGFNKPKCLTFTNKDGFEIDGWVIEPYGYEKGKKYPGFLEVHGGPRASYGRELMLDLQFISNQGYFVFYANPRGSGARGNEFSNINGKYGTVDYEDLMEFTDEVLKAYPDMDGDRLGVGGGSYGGFMSNWIIGHTDRFKAAIPQCSISNWITMYGCSDITNFCRSQMNGTPWSNYEELWRASPVKYADKVTTPTLFLQYSDDYRCPMQEAVQMYTALMIHKVTTRLVMFHGNSHKMRSLGKPSQRLRRCEEILNWLNKYVKGE